jgi:hypothetical protein
MHRISSKHSCSPHRDPFFDVLYYFLLHRDGRVFRFEARSGQARLYRYKFPCGYPHRESTHGFVVLYTPVIHAVTFLDSLCCTVMVQSNLSSTAFSARMTNSMPSSTTSRFPFVMITCTLRDRSAPQPPLIATQRPMALTATSRILSVW